MKKYEIVYIIHPDLEGSTAKITEKVKKAIEDQKGKVFQEESWGKKKLAYEVKHNTFGIYEFVAAEIEPSKIKEVERSLRLSEEIIRSMIVLVEEKIEPEAPKKRVNKPTKIEKKEKAKEEKPKKTKVETKKEEKERQKELDEKLKEIIGG